MNSPPALFIADDLVKQTRRISSLWLLWSLVTGCCTVARQVERSKAGGELAKLDSQRQIRFRPEKIPYRYRIDTFWPFPQDKQSSRKGTRLTQCSTLRNERQG